MISQAAAFSPTSRLILSNEISRLSIGCLQIALPSFLPSSLHSSCSNLLNLILIDSHSATRATTVSCVASSRFGRSRHAVLSDAVELGVSL